MIIRPYILMYVVPRYRCSIGTYSRSMGPM